MAEPTIQEVDGGVVFTVKTIPGSRKTALCGELNGMVKIKVSTAPEKGKANQRLLKFLAEQLSVKNNAVSIISGQTSPVKRVRVLGILAETLLKRLNLGK